jgi:hypothetical protein
MDLICTCDGEGKPREYSDKYDCYYCGSCNKWIEDICTDRDCVFCNSRPLTPNEKNINQS